MDDPDDVLPSAWRAFLADPDSAAEFAEAALPGLIGDLAVRNPRADEGDIVTAAGDAVRSLIKNPAAYDPARLSLAGYLRMSARGDLLNLRRAEGRHHRNRTEYASVELGLAGRNQDDERGDAPTFDAPELQPALAALSEPERRAFELLRAGERRTAAFADALGLSHLPAEEQEREVKRAKDRIKARLKRAVAQAAGGGDA